MAGSNSKGFIECLQGPAFPSSWLPERRGWRQVHGRLPPGYFVFFLCVSLAASAAVKLDSVFGALATAGPFLIIAAFLDSRVAERKPRTAACRA